MLSRKVDMEYLVALDEYLAASSDGNRVNGPVQSDRYLLRTELWSSAAKASKRR